MKKFLLLFIVVMDLTTAKLQAQTEKGNLMLGGGFSLQVSDGNTVAVFNPNLGYFILNNVAVGAQFALIATDGNTAWALGPYIRGYFLGSTKGKFFAQGGFNIGGAEGSDVHAGFGIGAGYALFLNQSIALEFAASYNDIGDEGVFGLGVGFQIHFKK